MSAAPTLQLANRLVQGLPRKDRDRILKQCTTVDLDFGDILCQPDQRIRHVYFPIAGFISLVVTVHGHPPLETGLIGQEGMLGATLALGIDTAGLRAVVQGSGSALRMTAEQFRCELDTCPALLRTLNRYLYLMLAQLSQVAACGRFHLIEGRLARLLLMAHDRVQKGNLQLTHESLAEMLGMQRSAVTIAAGNLQRKKLIRYARGQIRVLNRPRLEAACCECYAAANEYYRRSVA